VTLQLGLLAGPVEEVAIEPTSEILYAGAGARSVPSHRHVPAPRPEALATDEEWLRVLAIAEGLIRWRHWPHPHPLPLEEVPDVVGGTSDSWHDRNGVALGARGRKRLVRWPALFRGLAEQRAHEPHIADARDLAHAYKAAATYRRYYLGEHPEVAGGDEEFRSRAEAHLRALVEIIAALGGDPEFLEREGAG
jgi:hypothetical protein